MRFTLPPGPPITFRARLHDARTATAIGRWLALAFVVCFATGVLSHFLQHPPGWLADHLPSRPYWGYRLTQGLHVASGIAAIPLLLAKLWAVYRGCSRGRPYGPSCTRWSACRWRCWSPPPSSSSSPAC